MDADDFDEGSSAVPEFTLNELKMLAQEMIDAQAVVDEYQEILNVASERLNQLKNKIVPEKLTAAGMISLTLDDGKIIEIKDFVSGSLPKDPEARALAVDWLEDHGGESLLKTSVAITFRKEEHNLALDTISRLKELGLEPEVSFGVHAATLQAFAREALSNGDPLDVEILGLYVGKVAKIKEPKAPRKKKVK